MTVLTTLFDWNYHSTKKHYDNINNDEYYRHNVDIYNMIKINGKDYQAVYQNGLSYRNNNYSTPCITPELSSDGGTDNTLLMIDSTDIDDIDDGFIETLNDETINTVELAREVKHAINLNNMYANDSYHEFFGDEETPLFMKD